MHTLNFTHNFVSVNGAAKLGDTLTHGCIQELDLSWCDMGACGMTALAEGLKNSKDLRTLKLSHNNINHHCLPALAKVLLCNTSVEVLDFSANSLGSNGARVMGYVLKKNKKYKL